MEEAPLTPTVQKVGKPDKLSKKVINIIRTTQRNNIELTHIADNKAHVLLSLNAIMITFLLPMIIPNFDKILNGYLIVPLVLLTLTCFTTMYLSALVLKPSKFNTFKDKVEDEGSFSPFFFGNFYEMKYSDFSEYLKEMVGNQDHLQDYLAQDLFFIGRRLGYKMQYIRMSYNIFIIGVFLTLLSTAVILTITY